MPKAKDYPNFDLWDKPSLNHVEPGPPEEYYNHYEEDILYTSEGYNDVEIEISSIKLKEGETLILASGEDVATLSIKRISKRVKTPYFKDHQKNYVNALKSYEKAKIKYKQDIKEWKVKKKRWDGELKEEKEIAEKKELKRLLTLYPDQK